VVLLVFALLPGGAQAHGSPEAERIFPQAAAYPAAYPTIALAEDHTKGHSAQSEHCHLGPECSMQATFLLPHESAPHRAVLGAFIAFMGTHNTSWLLSFDPPPPRGAS